MDIWESLGKLRPSPTLVLVLVFVTLLSYATLRYWRRVSANPSPPGPWRIPLLGSTAFFTKFPPIALAKLCKKYGDVISLPVGNQTWVILGSADVIQEAFRKNSDVTSGRHRGEFQDTIFENGYGIGFNDSITHRIHKTFLTMTLKNLGVGCDVIEERIQDEVVKFIDYAKESKGKAFDPTDVINRRVFGIIGGMVFGSQFDADDSESIQYLENNLKAFKVFGPGILGDLFPILRYFPGDLCKHGAALKLVKYFESFLENQIQLHRNDQLGPEDEPKDFIDAFLEKAADVGKQTNDHSFTNKELINLLRELNAAATEPTSTIILFSLLYLLHFPELQQKIFDELTEVFPGDSLITARQRKLCPTTASFILECQRKTSITPFGINHRTREEVTIGGYRLPKNTTLVPNFWAVHRDPRVWKNPEEFDPLRFLDDNGILAPTSAVFFPFSLGRRSCPGEPMATAQMFIFIASIVRHFKLELPPGDSLPPMRGIFAWTITSHPFRLKFLPRG